MSETDPQQGRLRLDSIKLAGFKSFVDPTTVPFPKEFTTVVGPNGCGKSNIIDAVRWVMGESSAKHLRGAQMSDVIFNGSTARKPAGQATIELIFNNPDGAIGGEYAAYAKLAIRRTVTRDGQSQYFINGTRCRRKDIADVFLGTGLGPRSYAIIEQGTISRVIEAKPHEFRVHLEEAAGITQYHERRKETESRIRHTKDNLDRLNDLREELSKQLEHLQRQARAAERYKEYKTEEHQLKAQLIVLRCHGLSQQWQAQSEKISHHEVELASQLAEQQKTDTRITQLRLDVTEQRDVFEAVQQHNYTVGGEIARLEQSLQHGQERQEQLRKDVKEAENAWNDFATHLDEDQARIAQLTEKVSTQKPQREQAQQQKEAKEVQLQQAQQAMEQWQKQWDDFQEQFATAAREMEVQQTRIRHLEQQLAASESQRERWRQDQMRLDATDIAVEIPQLKQQVDDYVLTVEKAQQQSQTTKTSLEEARINYSEAMDALAVARKTLQEKQAQCASLKAVQQAALGQKDETTVEWLQEKGLEAMPRLAQSLEVEPGWEKAVETVLGHYLQAVCIPEVATVASLLDALPKSHIDFFVTQAASHTVNSGLGVSLGQKVSSSYDLSSLLQCVYLAEDWERALALLPQLAGHESVITREGLWLGANWLRITRGQQDAEGIIQRERTIKELLETIAKDEEHVQTLEQKIQTTKQQCISLEQQLSESHHSLRLAEKQLSDTRAQLTIKENRYAEIGERLESIKVQLEQVTKHISQYKDDLQQAQKKRQIAMEKVQLQEQTRNALQTERDEKQNHLAQCRGAAQAASEHLQATILQLQSVQTQLQSTQETIHRMSHQKESLMERKAQLYKTLEDSAAPIEETKKALASILDKRSAIEENLRKERQALENMTHELQQKEEKRSELEQVIYDAREQLEKLRIAAQEIDVRRNTYTEQLMELNETYEAVFDSLPEEATVEEWQAQLERMENKIRRLGAINLAAIDEFSTQSERKVYLDQQNEDLMEALSTLESAIHKIDQETRQRFKETFEQVNKNFQALFPKVFGGGSAYLELTDNNLLEAGVSVMARPPGKKNASIHLLSGGEKAMTAVALVFSIFQLRPAPFCMLDEVDAPLDDANVGRFVKLIQEMATKVQFVVISHNKITMEAATHLAGVTMHEPGVSRLVSVDMQEAVALVEA
ncbi:MAG: chromosome segregation protein SMC [Gammaproteobacteria bacterium]